jgi:hypothetical protein
LFSDWFRVWVGYYVPNEAGGDLGLEVPFCTGGRKAEGVRGGCLKDERGFGKKKFDTEGISEVLEQIDDPVLTGLSGCPW